MSDILDLELGFELKALRKEIDKLKSEIDTYKKVIKDNELEDEVEGFDGISPEEKICLDGIGHLVELFKNGTYCDADVKNFDLLHKNLRLIRGQNTDSKKRKGKFNKDEALAIVEGFKKDG